MTAGKTRPRDAAIGTGLGRVLLLVYGIFALSASARALVQITTMFHEAPLAYLLSALAGLVYIAATIGLAIGGPRGRAIALTSCSIELIGVLAESSFAVATSTDDVKHVARALTRTAAAIREEVLAFNAIRDVA